MPGLPAMYERPLLAQSGPCAAGDARGSFELCKGRNAPPYWAAFDREPPTRADSQKLFKDRALETLIPLTNEGYGDVLELSYRCSSAHCAAQAL
jgi:hypothetical protein